MNKELDSKSIRDLLLEYKAEVVEEEVVDEDAEVGLTILSLFVVTWSRANSISKHFVSHMSVLKNCV